MIQTKILAHSLHPNGKAELVSFEFTYPRFIHSELMTHRAFTRNAASSRAIPIKKMIAAVWSNPAMPERWGSNGRGMQDSGVLVGARLAAARGLWRLGSKAACVLAWCLEKAGLHKQIANRVLEPFGHITTIVTTALPGLMNFFGLRAHKDAQPEFQVLAYQALGAYLSSVPLQLQPGDWHIPMSEDLFLPTFRDLFNLPPLDKVKVATGRMARTSYLTHHGTRDAAADIELHDRLSASGHWSPFEHCAHAADATALTNRGGNFGAEWVQYRKLFPNELRKLERADLERMLREYPAQV
jgi:hypothetical protein